MKTHTYTYRPDAGVFTLTPYPETSTGELVPASVARRLLGACKAVVNAADPVERREDGLPRHLERYLIGQRQIDELKAAIAAAEAEGEAPTP